jgi:hypothetical protein
MADRMQVLSIPCRGGLNTSSNNHELLAKPGEAIDLVNFECSKEGGYRRINGYELLTAEVPIDFSYAEAGNETYVKGVINYKGVLAARGNGVYHTVNNTTWTQVNRTMNNVPIGSVGAAPIVPRPSGVRYMFARHYYNNKEYIYMVDGVNLPAVFSISDTGLYRYATFNGDNVSNPLMGAKYCTFFKNQLVLAGMTKSPTSIFYSSSANSDLILPEDSGKETPQENFNGATAGSLDLGDVVTGIMVHRETLYVFCEHSIFKVQGLESGEVISVPVTRDIGCVDGFTIQEVGGDLVFLAPDGLRTIAKTERLDDIELGVISRKAGELLSPRVRQANRYLFSSTVIREKNQYRIWFTDLENPLGAQRGMIAAFTYIAETGAFEWAFSELSGFGSLCNDNGYHNGAERIIGANHEEPYVMLHEKGFLFNGEPIDYVCQLVYSDYGQLGVRKTLHKVLMNSRAEGNVEAGLEVRYDYNGKDVFQPDIYPLERMTLPAIFGKTASVFGDPIVLFGAATYGDTDVYTEGSGFTVSLRVRPLKTIPDASFDIQSFHIDLTTGGKI